MTKPQTTKFDATKYHIIGVDVAYSETNKMSVKEKIISLICFFLFLYCGCYLIDLWRGQ